MKIVIHVIIKKGINDNLHVSLISHYTHLSEPHLMMCFPGCEEQCLCRNDDLL